MCFMSITKRNRTSSRATGNQLVGYQLFRRVDDRRCRPATRGDLITRHGGWGRSPQRWLSLAALVDHAAGKRGRHRRAERRGPATRIAASARANKAQPYAYFGGKEAHFEAVFTASLEGFVNAVPIDATDLLGYAVRLYDEYLEHPEHPALVRLATWSQLDRRLHRAPHGRRPTARRRQAGRHREGLAGRFGRLRVHAVRGVDDSRRDLHDLVARELDVRGIEVRRPDRA